jgi:hypothetical protein
MSPKSSLSLLDALDQSLVPEATVQYELPANNFVVPQAPDIRRYLNGGESSKKANSLDKLLENQRSNAGVCQLLLQRIM